MSAASVSLPVDSLPAASRMVPVILSGGSGTRLWPLSREQLPKQCLALCSEHTLLQDTLLRLVGVPELAAPLIVCNEQHRFLVAEQLRQIGREPAGILLEPAGRNTAPAVAIAALDAASRDPETLLLVLPADHLIQEPERFHEALGAARAAAQLGHLVTFGIVPTTPETGYGYIRGADAAGETGWQSVAAFVEKPDLERAEADIDGQWQEFAELLRHARDCSIGVDKSPHTRYNVVRGNLTRIYNERVKQARCDRDQPS